MEFLTSDYDLVLKAFWLTLQLAVLSGIASLLLGTLLGAMRVSPVSVLRRAASVSVGGC